MLSRPLCLLAVLIAGTPAFSEPASDLGSAKARIVSFESSLCDQADPGAAGNFLEDRPVLDRLKSSNPAEAAALFERAAQLKDYREVLSTYKEADSLGAALTARLMDDRSDPADCRGLGFGPKPERLAEWAARFVPSADGEVLRRSLWDWKAMSGEQRRWLTANQETQASWENSSFARRETLMATRGARIYDDLVKSSPRSENDLKAIGKQAADIWQSLDDGRRNSLREWLDQSASVLQAINKIGARAEALKNPAIRRLLDRARNSGSLEDSASALSEIFDELGSRNKALAVEAPAPADETLTDEDRGLLGEMLGRRLLMDIAATTAGRKLNDFYKTHTLKIRIQDLPGRVGQFVPDTGELILNEKLVASWLKGENQRPRDLFLRDGELERLTMLLSATFVHEATHQMQVAWARENAVPLIYGQQNELESMSVEALFVLQQSKARPDYKAYLERSQSTYSVASLDLSFGRALALDSRAFRKSMMTDQYAPAPSLEAGAASALEQTGNDAVAGRRIMDAYREMKDRYDLAIEAVDRGLRELLRQGFKAVKNKVS